MFLGQPANVARIRSSQVVGSNTHLRAYGITPPRMHPGYTRQRFCCNAQPPVVTREMIRRIQIEHFRSIGHLDLSLRDINIFVGPNATGKSNIVDAIRFLKDAMVNGIDRAVSDRQGIDTIRQWSPTRPYHVSIEVVIETKRGSGRYRITLGSKKGNYLIHSEDGEWSRRTARFMPSSNGELDEKLVRETIYFSRTKEGSVACKQVVESIIQWEATFEVEFIDELFLKSPFPRPPRTHTVRAERIASSFPTRGLIGLEYLRRELSDFEAYSIFPNTLRSPQNPTNDERLHSDGSNFASVFRALMRNRAGQQGRSEIIDSIKLILPNLKDISIQLVGGFLTPVFRVIEQDGNQHDFNVSQISDGTLRMLGLLTAVYHPNRPQALALEEPEQTVNPGVLIVLADAIKSVAGRSQCIITTHSPSLIDYFDVDEIFPVGITSQGTSVQRLQGAQLEAVRRGLFSAGELMLVEGIGG